MDAFDRVLNDPSLADAVLEAEAVVVVDDDRRFIAANPAACELLGRPQAALLGAPLDAIATPRASALVARSWGRLLEEGSRKSTVEILRPDGESRFVDFNFRAAIRPGAHLFVFRDATERVQTERALREWFEGDVASGAAGFERGLGALEDAVMVLRAVRDAAGGIVDETIEYVNTAWRLRILGAADAALPPGATFRTALPQFSDRWETHRHVIETGETVRTVLPFAGGDGWYDTEYVKLGDGLIVLARDVTARVLAERRVAESEAILRGAFESYPGGAAILESVVDGQGRFVDATLAYVNPAGRIGHFEGLPLDDLLGSRVFERFPRLRDAYFEHCRAVAETREPRLAQVRRTMADGSERLSEVRLYPFDRGIVVVGLSTPAERAVRLELERNEERLRSLAERLPVGIQVLRVRADGGMGFDFYSAQAARIIGVDAADVLRDPTIAFSRVHPDDIPEIMDRPVPVDGVYRSFRREARITVDGGTRWIRIESEPEPLENGDVLWHGIVSDITDEVAGRAGTPAAMEVPA